ncbi:MAG: hypothetical protein PVG79_01010 [Gemmatimonadales bacterium]|jgi:type II secretory pathway pseudopilin PulG
MLETLVAVILVAILITVVGARYRTAKQAAYATQMRAETRDLISAQTAFYGTASLTSTGARYAASLEQLAFVPQKHVLIELRGDTRGWAALVTSVELPADEYFCSVHVGDVEPYDPAGEEGVMRCEPGEN